jgi:hypothetical protein
VSENDNPSLYRILAEHHRPTGIPGLINTSFNMREEPIVRRPGAAIRALKMGRLGLPRDRQLDRAKPEPDRAERRSVPDRRPPGAERPGGAVNSSQGAVEAPGEHPPGSFGPPPLALEPGLVGPAVRRAPY